MIRENYPHLTTSDAWFEVKYNSEFIEARRLLARALQHIDSARAGAIGDENIALTTSERMAVNGITLLLIDIYGEDNE